MNTPQKILSGITTISLGNYHTCGASSAGPILCWGENIYGQVLCAAGPDVIESREYYQIIANILGVGLEIEEIPVKQHLADHPETAVFICHRFYDLSKLRASGAAVPSTPIEQGLREHVESLLV